MKVNILTDRQTAFLERFGAEEAVARDFYLTGGTALAAWYLYHRYSEDVDFFSETEIDSLALDVFFSNTKKDLGITKIDFQQSYNRNLFFLHFGNEVLKTEFTYFPFPRIELGRYEYGVRIDSLLDIAVNKLFTIYQRTAARDYIDLYSICKEKQWALHELTEKARMKFDWHIDPLQLGTQLMKAKEAKDYPRMIKDMPLAEWHDFFIVEAKKLKPDILA